MTSALCRVVDNDSLGIANPERLKEGFLIEYHRLKKTKELSADELFDLMCRFAQRGLHRQIERTAGLAVLVYLFETCEVFEK